MVCWTYPDSLLMIPLIILFFNAGIVPASPSATYDVGQTYNYQYVTTVVFNEPDASQAKNVTYQVMADVAATAVWQNPTNTENLLLLNIRTPKLLVIPKDDQTGQFKSHASTLENTKDEAIFLHMKDGAILELYTENTQSSLHDIKSGIASLFQFQPHLSNTVEIDASGKCEVTYSVANSGVYKKSKNNCVGLSLADYKKTSHMVFETELHSKIITSYVLTKANVIASVDSSETRTAFMKIVRNAGSSVQSKQSLRLVDEEPGSSPTFNSANIQEVIEELKKTGLLLKRGNFNAERIEKTMLCHKFPEYINGKRKALKTSNLAKVNLVSVFLEAVQRIRSCSKETLKKVLMNSKNKGILPQLIDIYAAANSVDAFHSVVEVLNFDTDKIDLPERFLIALSAASNSNFQIIQELLSLVKRNRQNIKLHETLLLTLGTVAQKFLSINKDVQLEKDILSVFTTKFNECQEDACKGVYLRALKSACLQTSLPLVLDVLRKEHQKLKIEALNIINALVKSSPNVSVSEKLQRTLLGTYHQLYGKMDSTSRMLAAEILINTNPDIGVIGELLEELGSCTSATRDVELNTYVIGLVYENAAKDEEFKHKLHTALKNPRLGNYNILAQNGNSAAFTKLLYALTDFNATYSVHLEMAAGGVIKKGTYGVDFSHDGTSLRPLSFGVFARGLASVAGDGASQNGDTEDAVTAGIELEIFGSALRPYTLFTGQGELISLVWAGTGSESTPIVQGNFLPLAERQSAVLQSGIALEMSLFSAVSFDASGSIQVSLWNRNAHANIATKAAVILQVISRLETDFMKAQINISSSFDGSLEFINDLEFYEPPFKTCTQMIQTPISARQIISKVERTPGTKHYRRHVKRTAYSIPSHSYALNKKNSLLCKQLFNS